MLYKDQRRVTGSELRPGLFFIKDLITYVDDKLSIQSSEYVSSFGDTPVSFNTKSDMFNANLPKPPVVAFIV